MGINSQFQFDERMGFIDFQDRFFYGIIYSVMDIKG